MSNSLQLFKFPEIHDALVDSVKTFIDPMTLPDPEDPDAPEATTLFNDNVRKSRPKSISLYGEELGIVTLDDVPDTIPPGIGEDEVAKITGGLLVWIRGRSDKATTKCEHYCDVSGAYFKNQDLLGMPGVTITRVQRSPYRWTNINLADIKKLPVFYTLGYVGFEIEAYLDDIIYTVP